MTGSGLLLDFHGQRHGQNSTELGYVYRWDEQSRRSFILHLQCFGCNNLSLCRKSDLNEGILPTEGVASVSALLARFRILVKSAAEYLYAYKLEHVGATS